MKGGGLTWAGWLMLGGGGLLIYAGMTGQSLVTELGAVLAGKKLAKAGGAPAPLATPAAPAAAPLPAPGSPELKEQTSGPRFPLVGSPWDRNAVTP